MIINNYSMTSLKAHTPDKPLSGQGTAPAEESLSATPSGLATPPQDASLRQQAEQTAIRQTSVLGAEKVTNQATEKEIEAAELLVTRKLSERDREVRNHERIHASIGGAHASAPSYSYQRGPDGRLYAVDGEVRIDTSPVPDNPQATLEKAEVIMRAALSVPEPSTQDRRVAAEARVMAAEARAEIAKAEEAKTSENMRQDEVEEETEKRTETEDPDKKSLYELNAERQEADKATAEALQEFNNRLNDINKTLRKINLRLIDAGVFEKLFPEGSVIDKNI